LVKQAHANFQIQKWRNRFIEAYEEPLTSFSLGLAAVSVVGFMVFLLRIAPLPPPRLPRSRCALGGGPLADGFVVPPAAAACCDEEFD
jgi:hypothetical protein